MARIPQPELSRRARALYLGGLSLEQVAARLELTPGQVGRWATREQWPLRRQSRLGDPRGAAASLRQVLGRKVEQVLAAGQLDPAAADELAKIGATLARLEGTGYDLAAATVEVSERLAAFAATWERDPARRAWLAELLAAFFRALEQEA